MKRGTSLTNYVAAAAIEVALVDGAPATKVKLLPIGPITMRDGRGPYLVRDRAHAEQIVAATKTWLGSHDFNFDYGHAVMRDQGAIASGWGKTLMVEDDGIYADHVAWTPAATQKLVDREYRYISPLFVAAKSGEVLRLKNASLVTIGAIDLPAVAASHSDDGDDMNLTAITAALGLAATATVEEIAAAAAAVKAKADAPATSAIAVAAGLAADASPETIAASVVTLKAKADKPDLSGYIPAAIVEPMREQLKTLNGERLAKKVDELVAAGIVIPAKRDETLAWFEKDEVMASAWFKDMPPIVKPGAALTGGLPKTDPNSLTAEEVAVAAALGMTEAEMLEAKKEDAGYGAR